MIVQEKEDKDLNPGGRNRVEEERVRNSQRHQQRAISDLLDMGSEGEACITPRVQM